ncbi:hypothetical protein [Paenibacillus maysiensis]|uniref:hypothetical protein n=1 Tax=Paenibacillus maysiensis TaxID=1155954 RepID=UPI0004727470|nr:hypothetical protein [Paenibacillus maysiensis]
MTSQSDMVAEYEKLVELEKQYTERIQTCVKLLGDAFNIIAAKAGALSMDSVKEAAYYYLHSTEIEINHVLYYIRLEKSILTNQLEIETK